MKSRSPIMVLVALAAAATPALAQSTEPEAPSRVARAIDQGLGYLAKQQRADGSWVEKVGYKRNEEYRARDGPSIAVAALAGMSFLASGSRPGEGKHGANITRALDWLAAQQQPDGFITATGSRAYEHAFAMSFLAEALSATPDSRMRPALASATAWLVRDQLADGGWGYDTSLLAPGREEPAKRSDLSVTACCVGAMVAARDAGVEVPPTVLERALAYVMRSAIRDYPDRSMVGGFWYQVLDDPVRHSRTSFALTAAGVASLQLLGAGESTEARTGLKFVGRRSPRWHPPAWRMHQSFDYFYGHYFAMKAMRRAGGLERKSWGPEVAFEICSGQHREGYWEDLVGKCYATAMATLILQEAYRGPSATPPRKEK